MLCPFLLTFVSLFLSSSQLAPLYLYMHTFFSLDLAGWTCGRREERIMGNSPRRRSFEAHTLPPPPLLRTRSPSSRRQPLPGRFSRQKNSLGTGMRLRGRGGEVRLLSCTGREVRTPSKVSRPTLRCSADRVPDPPYRPSQTKTSFRKASWCPVLFDYLSSASLRSRSRAAALRSSRRSSRVG